MTPAGLARLKLDEGVRLAAYPDPLSGGDPWTVGYGHTGKNVHQGLIISTEDADTLLKSDVANAEHLLGVSQPWFLHMDPVRADVLSNIAFNIGVSGLLKWAITLGDFRMGRWADAARALRHEGAWNLQVHDRAERLAVATESGTWA